MTSDGPGRHDHGQDHGQDHGPGARGFRGALAALRHPHKHDHADSIDDALLADQAGRRALVVSLCGLLVTGVAQAVIVGFTGSVGLLADTVHNFADALTALPIGLAFWAAASARPRWPPTGAMPGPTASPAWPSSRGRPGLPSAGRRPTRRSGCSSPSRSWRCCAARSVTSTAG